MKLLLSNGANPNAKFKDLYDNKNSLLTYAIKKNIPYAVDILIKYGADVFFRGTQYYSRNPEDLYREEDNQNLLFKNKEPIIKELVSKERQKQ